MGDDIISGRVIKGLGEGTRFMSMEHYKKEIKEKLGFDAFPGTLNVKVDQNQLEKLSNCKKIIINGFEKNGKKFGGAVCFKAKIKEIKGSIIIPDINKHEKNIIEFISKTHVKSELNIENGDEISVELEK